MIRVKRILLGAAIAALPLLGAATLAAGPASAAPAARVPLVKALPNASGPCGSGNYDAEHATLTYGGAGNYGTVTLCWESNHDVWAIVQSSVGACSATTEVGCGGAEIDNIDTGANKSCSIPVGSSSCTTGKINDDGTQSVASAWVVIGEHGSKVARGATVPY